MIRLDRTTRKLQISLGGAVAANELQVITSFIDRWREGGTTHEIGATQIATTSGATDVDIVDAPARSEIVRDLDYLSVRNRDTAAVTVNIEYDDNGTDYPIYSVTLAVGDLLTYSRQTGWVVLNSTGGTLGSGGVNGPGSSTDNAVVRWNGTNGTAVQNSGVIVDDSNNITGVAGLTATSVTDSGLTSGRVVIASTGGLLADDADLTFSVNTLTVHTLTVSTGALTAGVLTATGDINFGSAPGGGGGDTLLNYGHSAKGSWATLVVNTQDVSTTATIMQAAWGGGGTGIAYVHGKDTAANNFFFDVVVYSDSGDTTATLSSTTTFGSPSARTYTVSGSNLQLAMTSGTYDVNVLAFEAQNPI